MMKNERLLRFLVLFITTISLLLFTAFYISSVWDLNLFFSVLAGSILAIINFSIGFWSMKKSISKSNRVFLLVLWMGMLIRLIFILLLVFIGLKFLELNTIGFIFSILFFYVFYLIIEILYLNLKKIEHFER